MGKGHECARRDDVGLPCATDDPPPVPEKFREAFDRLEASNVSDRVKRALRWVAAGYSWFEAAEIMGYQDTGISHVRRHARRYGILSALSSTDRLVGQSREIAMRAGEELQRRLEDEPENFSPKELGVTRGIEMDKIANYEGWRSGNGGEGSSFVTELKKIALERGHVKLSLEVEPSPHPGPGAAIDLTSQGTDER